MTADFLYSVLSEHPASVLRYSDTAVLGSQNIASETSFSRSMRRFQVEMLGTT